ncbi:MAG: BtpA/SgcQ family protein, partial [Myxococcota bacterium]|nr:BtpA/SgcQ family protein [Myxococcota bacterium]
TDQGLLQGDAFQTLCYRSALGLEPGASPGGGVQLFADIFVKHGSPAGERDIADVARDTVLRGRADGLIVTGGSTGSVVDLDRLEVVVDAVPDVPVLAGSGVTPDIVPAIRDRCAGAVVGTFLHHDGVVTAPVSVERVRRLVTA